MSTCRRTQTEQDKVRQESQTENDRMRKGGVKKSLADEEQVGHKKSYRSKSHKPWGSIQMKRNVLSYKS